MSSIHAEHLWNKSFILCLVNNLFIFIFYFAQTTILPIYILNDLGGTITQAGLALTLFLASSIAVRPFTGLIIEKIGLKKAIYISETFFVILSFAYLFADQLHTLFIIRIIQGVWFSILTTAMIPIVNDFIPNNRKGEGMGYFVMSVNLAIVLGPMLGLILIQPLGYFSVASLLAVIVLIGYLFCFFIPIQNQPEIKTTKQRISIHDFVEFKALPVSIMAMLISFSYAGIMSFISTYAESKNLLTYASLFFAVFAAAMMILRPLTGKLYDQKGPKYIVYPAIISFSIGLFILSQIDTVLGLVISAIFIGAGFGSVQPSLQTQAIQAVSKDRIGHASSTFYSFYDIGIAIGSFVLGMIITQSDYSVAYTICSILTLLSLLFYHFCVQETKS